MLVRAGIQLDEGQIQLAAYAGRNNVPEPRLLTFPHTCSYIQNCNSDFKMVDWKYAGAGKRLTLMLSKAVL